MVYVYRLLKYRDEKSEFVAKTQFPLNYSNTIWQHVEFLTATLPHYSKCFLINYFKSGESNTSKI